MEGSAGPKLPRGGAAARRYGASTTLRKPPTSSGEVCPVAFHLRAPAPHTEVADVTSDRIELPMTVLCRPLRRRLPVRPLIPGGRRHAHV